MGGGCWKGDQSNDFSIEGQFSGRLAFVPGDADVLIGRPPCHPLLQAIVLGERDALGAPR